jgi:hypothetical protein
VLIEDGRIRAAIGDSLPAAYRDALVGGQSDRVQAPAGRPPTAASVSSSRISRPTTSGRTTGICGRPTLGSHGGAADRLEVRTSNASPPSADASAAALPV